MGLEGYIEFFLRWLIPKCNEMEMFVYVVLRIKSIFFSYCAMFFEIHKSCIYCNMDGCFK